MIEFKNVSKHFGPTQVLHDISLKINQGEVVVIIGPSGSGKSTMLRCINKLEEITSGDLIVDGLKVNDPKVDERLIRQEAGMVFQQFYLFPHLTALENVMFGPLRVRGASKQAAEKQAKELLAKVGLAERAHHYPSELSGGQQQRVALARALAPEPLLLLLDEIEKAHPDVYNILLQVFDDGRLTDGKGRVVDFTNTIIIATSNLGSDIIQRRLKARGAAGEEYEKTKAGVMDVLRGHFRPEFLNRIDEIIVFHALGKEEIRHIVGLQLDRVARSAASQGVTLTFDQTLIDHFAEEGYKPEFGARELKRLIRSELETALAREMLGGGIGKGDHASARWDDKAERVVFERKEPPQTPAEPEQPDAAKASDAS